MADLAFTNVQFKTKPKFDSIQAGEALAQFDVIYNNGGKWFKAAATAEASAKGQAIVLMDVALDEYAPAFFFTTQNIVIQLTGQASVAATRYVVSATAGKLAPVADLVSTNYKTEVLIGVDTTDMKTDYQATGIQVA